MKQIPIPEENRHFFTKKEHLSDFECWALKKFAFEFGFAINDQYWWSDSELYIDSGTSLWLTDNGNVMYEIVSDDVDELYILRF